MEKKSEEKNKPNMSGFSWPDIIDSGLEGENGQISIKGGFHNLWSEDNEASNALQENAPSQAHIEILSSNPKTGSSTLIRLHTSQAELLHMLLGIKIKQAKDWHNMVVKPFLDRHIARINAELQITKSPALEVPATSISQEGQVEETTEVASSPPALKPPAADLWHWLFDNVYRKQWKKVESGWITPEGNFVPKDWVEIKRWVKLYFYRLPQSEQEPLIREYHKYFPYWMPFLSGF